MRGPLYESFALKALGLFFEMGGGSSSPEVPACFSCTLAAIALAYNLTDRRHSGPLRLLQFPQLLLSHTKTRTDVIVRASLDASAEANQPVIDADVAAEVAAAAAAAGLDTGMRRMRHESVGEVASERRLAPHVRLRSSLLRRPWTGRGIGKQSSAVIKEMPIFKGDFSTKEL